LDNKPGRPPKDIVLTEEQVARAIELASAGEPLRIIINEILLNEYEFFIYKQNNPSFSKKFEQARQEGLEHIADGLITIADDYADVQRGRLKSENARWLLSKRKPSVYGDKVDIHVSQTIDISSALNEAKARAMIDVTPIQNQLISGQQKPENESE
jgi:hypothetical protein